MPSCRLLECSRNGGVTVAHIAMPDSNVNDLEAEYDELSYRHSYNSSLLSAEALTEEEEETAVGILVLDQRRQLVLHAVPMRGHVRHVEVLVRHPCAA